MWVQMPKEMAIYTWLVTIISAESPLVLATQYMGVEGTQVNVIPKVTEDNRVMQWSWAFGSQDSFKLSKIIAYLGNVHLPLSY
jgi:hypothetical protein